MIYKIDSKYYVKVQGYYIEVTPKVTADDIRFVPSKDKDAKKIEVSKAKNVEVLSFPRDKDKVKSTTKSADYDR